MCGTPTATTERRERSRGGPVLGRFVPKSDTQSAVRQRNPRENNGQGRSFTRNFTFLSVFGLNNGREMAYNEAGGRVDHQGRKPLPWILRCLSIRPRAGLSVAQPSNDPHRRGARPHGSPRLLFAG